MKLLDSFWIDLRSTFRSARRTPAFYALAIAILSIGIAMSTAMATALHTVVLRDLPVHEQDELVVLHAEDRARGLDHVPLSHAMFEEFRGGSTTLASAGAFHYAGAWPRDFRVGERHVRARGLDVAGAFFETLGATAALGRTLLPEDYGPTAEAVTVISHDLWVREFGADPGVLGQRLSLVFSDALELTIVGVMRPGFRVPGDTEVWLPLPRVYGADPAVLQRLSVDVMARLAPGASATTATLEIERYLAAQTISSSYAESALNGVGVPLHESEVGDVRPVLLIIATAAALLLLIACFNVAVLVLMRGSKRRSELQVRKALGASRRRVVSLLASEGIVIALVGGAVGWLMVDPLLAFLTRLAPEGLPRIQDLEASGAALAIAVGATTVVAVLSALFPAWSAASAAGSGLRSGHARTTGSRMSLVGRRILVSAQFGLAVVVLSAAGLVLKTLDELQSLDPGFVAEGVVHAELAGPIDRIGPRETTAALFDRLLPALESRGSIDRAAAVNVGPFAGSGGYDARYVREGQSTTDAQTNPWLNFEIVSPGYFEVFDMPPRAGRLLAESDRAGSPLAVVLSESAADALWPAGDAVGRRIRTPREGSDWYEVVGIVADTRYREFRTPRPSIYFSASQSPYPIHPTQLVIRTSAGPAAAVSTLRQVVDETEPAVLVAAVNPLPDLMQRPLAQPRLNARLLTVFALTALLLAAVGLYGILAFAVRQRRRELGIRQALGASASDLVHAVLREGMIVALSGTAIGLALIVVLGQTLQALLFGVQPTDPLTLGGVLAFLAIVAFGACVFPAVQASRSDPSELLDAE